MYIKYQGIHRFPTPHCTFNYLQQLLLGGTPQPNNCTCAIAYILSDLTLHNYTHYIRTIHTAAKITQGTDHPSHLGLEMRAIVVTLTLIPKAETISIAMYKL